MFGINIGSSKIIIRISIGVMILLSVLLLWTKIAPALLATNGFGPHGECLLWNPALITLFVGSDSLTGIAYVFISAILLYFVLKAYRDLPFRWLFVAFGAFIVACGTTHFMDAITLWLPIYWLDGVVKLITAIASVATAVALVPMVPKILQLVETATLSEQRKEQLEQAHVQLAEMNQQLEAALRQSEQRYGYLAEAMPVLVWTVRADGTVEYVNQRWYEATGMTIEQLQERFWHTVVHPDDVQRCQIQWQRCMEMQEPYEVECRMHAFEGGYHWHLVRALPCLNEEDVVTSWVGTATDIEMQKRLEQLKDDFIAMASHELKTPLTSLKGFIQVLSRRFKGRDDAQVRLLLERMEEQTKKLARIINDLLDLSKMQKNQLSYQHTSFNVDDLLRNTIHLMQEITRNSLTYKSEAQEPIFVEGDKERIAQVLANLITNAIKYSPVGSPVHVSMQMKENAIQVNVRDFGIGIAEEQQERIFERFYQVTDPLEKTYPGLGIGLYLASEIIKHHQGQIWVESKKGEGSMFSFVLPVKIPTVEQSKNSMQGETLQ